MLKVLHRAIDANKEPLFLRVQVDSNLTLTHNKSAILYASTWESLGQQYRYQSKRTYIFVVKWENGILFQLWFGNHFIWVQDIQLSKAMLWEGKSPKNKKTTN